jgi:hypothetical protein
MFRKALFVILAITASIILAASFSTPQTPAALPPPTAPVVRITEADRLMQKIALELQRCRGDYDDFDTHCDASDRLLVQAKLLGWCLTGADHLSLHWRNAKLSLRQPPRRGDRMADVCGDGSRGAVGSRATGSQKPFREPSTHILPLTCCPSAASPERGARRASAAELSKDIRSDNQ